MRRPRAGRRLPAPPADRGKWAIAVSILVAAVAIVVTLRTGTDAEIDIRRLRPDTEPEMPEGTARATLVLEGDRVANRGEIAAENVEILEPTYRLVGTVPPGNSFEAPSGAVKVRYQWPNRWGIQQETKVFVRPRPAAVPSSSHQTPTGRQGQGSTTDERTVVSLPGAPDGLVAAYDAATHVLTVRAAKAVNVRADGYLLRPVRRTDTKTGTEYRYLPAKILVLGQNIQRGEAVTFEVVFTRPQEAYSIPLYVWEDGAEPVYIEVGVSVSGGGAG